MNIKIITETELNEAIRLLNNDAAIIEEDFLLSQMRSRQYIVPGCYVENELIGIAIITRNGHIICMRIKESWQTRGIEKLLFQEIYRICTQQLHVSRITVQASKPEVTMYSYLGFRICNDTMPDSSRAYTPMQFTVYPQDIRTAPENNKNIALIIAIVGGCFLLFIILIIAVSIFTYAVVRNTSQNYGDDYNYYDNYDYTDEYGYMDDYGFMDEYGYFDNFGKFNDYGYDDGYNGYDYGDNYNYNDEEETPLIANPYVGKNLSYRLEESSFEEYYWDDASYIDFDVSYPQIKGLANGPEGEINMLIKNRAMQTAENIYLHPTDSVKKEFAQNEYLCLSNYVSYEIAYMDENFISIVFIDNYLWGSIYAEFEDMFTLNINLKDGTIYTINDFLSIDADFTQVWIDIMLKENPECAPLLFLEPPLFEKILQTDGYVDGRYFTSFYVTGDGIHMGLTYHFSNNAQLSHGWADAPFPDDMLAPYARECDLWELITH